MTANLILLSFHLSFSWNQKFLLKNKYSYVCFKKNILTFAQVNFN